jgi:hypothetical protein
MAREFYLLLLAGLPITAFFPPRGIFRCQPVSFSLGIVVEAV